MTTAPSNAVNLKRTSVRVERRCPRCRDQGYHWLVVATRVCTCNNCGHSWRANVKREEVD